MTNRKIQISSGCVCCAIANGSEQLTISGDGCGYGGRDQRCRNSMQSDEWKWNSLSCNGNHIIIIIAGCCRVVSFIWLLRCIQLGRGARGSLRSRLPPLPARMHQAMQIMTWALVETMHCNYRANGTIDVFLFFFRGVLHPSFSHLSPRLRSCENCLSNTVMLIKI